MTRPLRPQYPGALYDATYPGNARAKVFLDDQERRDFLLKQIRAHLGIHWPSVSKVDSRTETTETEISRPDQGACRFLKRVPLDSSHYAERQSDAAGLLPLDTDEFIGHFEKTADRAGRGESRGHGRARVGGIKCGVPGAYLNGLGESEHQA